MLRLAREEGGDEMKAQDAAKQSGPCRRLWGEPGVGCRGPRPSGTVLLRARTSSVVGSCPVPLLIDGRNGGVERFGGVRVASGRGGAG